jgi:hypothetical protein
LAGLQFEASPGKTLARPISINKMSKMACVCNPRYSGGIYRRILAASLDKNKRPYLKTKVKRAGGVTQVVESLLKNTRL